MVAVPGDRGFHRIYDVDNDEIDRLREGRKRYIQTEWGYLKHRESKKGYYQTERGILKRRECQQRYDSTEKGINRRRRYERKPFHCDICNCNMTTNSKFKHFKSKKHVSKLT